MSIFHDRILTLRACGALAVANARYWPTVAPLVHHELSRWKRRAHSIPDPILKAHAVGKLRDEYFNAQVAATLATLAPAAHRTNVIKAIVAYEVMYDYLDALTEQQVPDPLHNGHQLFNAFVDAVAPQATAHSDYYSTHPQSADGGYLKELTNTVRTALAALPATTAVTEVAQRSATRCAEAQIRNHAASSLGRAQLEAWARHEALNTTLDWREYLAGSVSSVLAIHALIVAAADDRTTKDTAVTLDSAYLSICALSTLLDSLIDYEHDLRDGAPTFISNYENQIILTDQIVTLAERGATQLHTTPNGAHHVMTLVGVVAYYISAPTANNDFAKTVTAQVHRQLQPLITPTMGVMRIWRQAKKIYRQWQHTTPARTTHPHLNG